MIRLKLMKINAQDIEKANEYFPSDYIEALKRIKPSTFNESLVSRYIVSNLADEVIGIKGFIPELDFADEESDDFCYSISKKPGIIMVGISDDPIGIDIEVYAERDESAYDHFSDRELKILGGRSYDSFCVGWTAKESLMKYLGLGANDIWDIEVFRMTKEQNIIGGMIFDMAVMLNYEGNFFKAYAGKMQDICYSVII